MGSRVRVLGDLFHGKAPDGAVYIGRQAPGLKASPFANPHVVGRPCRTCAGRTHTRSEAVWLYQLHLDRCPELVEQARAEIGDRDVACWCREGDLCHGDQLIAAMAARSRDLHEEARHG